jgi:hypothetical protein
VVLGELHSKGPSLPVGKRRIRPHWPSRHHSVERSRLPLIGGRGKLGAKHVFGRKDVSAQAVGHRVGYEHPPAEDDDDVVSESRWPRSNVGVGDGRGTMALRQGNRRLRSKALQAWSTAVVDGASSS